MREIDVGADGSIFALGVKNTNYTNGNVYRWNGHNWEGFGGTGRRLAVDVNGHPWVVNHQNEIWRHTPKGWKKLPGEAIDIDIGWDGSVFVLGTDAPKPGQGTVYQWQGKSGWKKYGGYGKRIAVDGTGRPWIVNGLDEIWRSTKGGWKKLPGKARDIATGGNGAVWVVGVGGAPAGNGGLYRWNGSGWTNEGGYGETITVDAAGKPAVINAAGELWSAFFTPVTRKTLSFGTMRSHGGTKPVGKRPLLVLMVEYQDIRFRAPHDEDHFRELLFTGDRNLAEFIGVASDGKLEVTEADILGPIRHPENFECAHRWSSCSTSDGQPFVRAYAEALLRPKATGFDFAKYDKNGDKKVTDDELLVLVITAMDRPDLWAGGLSHAWPGGCISTLSSKVELCSRPALAAEGTGQATMAHELLHTLGLADIYGARSRMNGHRSLMAATERTQEDQHEYYLLDPWHRIVAGWAEPRIVLAAPGANTVKVRLERSGRGTKDARPVAIVDPNRARSGDFIEYFLVEYRSTSSKYDRDTPGTGVMVWSVRQRRSSPRLEVRPAIIDAGPDGVLQSTVAGDDVLLDDGKEIWFGPDRILQSSVHASDELETDGALFTISPHPAQPLGEGESWRQTGPHRLRWVSDNTPSYVQIEVPSVAYDPSAVEIEISFRG